MSALSEVRVPDIGDFDEVDVVEVLVSPGDRVEAEQGLVTLESDKASMEVPSPSAGTVSSVHVAVGDKVGQDALVVTLEVAADAVGDPAEDVEESDKLVASEASTPPATISTAAGNAGPATDRQTGLLVLGSGPGGYTAAFRAADLGLDVTLVERHASLGGVCLNVGCIPSKALLHVAEVIEETKAMASHGVRFGTPTVDLDGVREWKDGVVSRLTGGLATMAKQRGVTVVRGEGRFVGPHALAVEGPDGGEIIGFEQAIVAVGSRTVTLPGLPEDDPRMLDSTSALDLANVGGRMLVIGGGIIGLEMATVYHALGCRITVVELMDSLVPGCDRDLVRPLAKRLAQRYENIYLGTKVTAVEAEADGLRVRFDGPGAPSENRFDQVLVAVGRRPNGDRIGAEAAGLELDERGFLPVDKQQRTRQSHIFAIGDVVGQPMLAHKATHEGKVAAEVAAGHKAAFDARVIPAVAYTDPEVAWVGLTETQAKAEGIAYETGAFPWAASGRALALGRDEGRTKLLFDPTTKRLLGAGIVGPNAGDLVAEAALAIEMGAEAGDIGLTIHPHPTLSETVAFAAEAFEGTITDLYLPKRKAR